MNDRRSPLIFKLLSPHTSYAMKAIDLAAATTAAVATAAAVVLYIAAAVYLNHVPWDLLAVCHQAAAHCQQLQVQLQDLIRCTDISAQAQATDWLRIYSAK
jgi:hypothetical protein